MAKAPQTLDEFAREYRSQLKIKIPMNVVKSVTKSLHEDNPINENVIRALIDNYYQKQKARIRLQNQIRAISQGVDENVQIPQFSLLNLEMDLMNFEIMEANAKRFLKHYAESCQIGEWLLSIVGIGPIFAAGLIAYINIHIAKTPGQIERYAGIDPTRKWLSKAKYREIMGLSKPVIITTDDEEEEFTKYDDNSVTTAIDGKWVWAEDNTDTERTMVFNNIHKASGWKVNDLVNIWTKINAEKEGSTFAVKTNEFIKHLVKCPYNKRLKTIIHLIGESFVKTSGSEKSFYGPLYEQRKAYEIIKNENGEYADQAAEILRTKRFNKSTTAYKYYSEGKLPPGHIHKRSSRYSCKLMLSHLHTVWRALEGYETIRPYAISHLEHKDQIFPPNWNPKTKQIEIP